MTRGVGYSGTRDPNIAGVSSSGVSGSGVVAAVTAGYSATTVTWDPAKKGTYGVLSNGNLTLSGNNVAVCGVQSSALGKATGKYYYEVVLTTLTGAYVGLYVVGGSPVGTSPDSFLGYSTETIGRNCVSTTIRSNGNKGIAGGSAFASGDIIGVLVDFTNNTIKFQKNGVDNGYWTGFPAGTWAPALSESGLTSVNTARFDSASWTYPPPAGYDVWV